MSTNLPALDVVFVSKHSLCYRLACYLIGFVVGSYFLVNGALLGNDMLLGRPLNFERTLPYQNISWLVVIFFLWTFFERVMLVEEATLKQVAHFPWSPQAREMLVEYLQTNPVRALQAGVLRDVARKHIATSSMPEEKVYYQQRQSAHEAAMGQLRDQLGVPHPVQGQHPDSAT